MDGRTSSPDELLFAAIRIYEDAIVTYIRTMFSAQFPTTWLRQLQLTFGDVGWTRIVELARQANATSLQATSRDEFDYLGIAEFADVFDRHRAVLIPAGTNQVPLLREMQRLRVERNAVVHHRGNVPTLADAVALMNTVRHLLRALALSDDLRKIDDLINSTIGISPPIGHPASNETLIPSVGLFEGMFEYDRPELFIGPLMRFFQGVADNLYDSSEDEVHSADERWEWHRGAEAVALALQDILVSGLTIAGTGGLLRRAIGDADAPPPQSEPSQ